MFFFSPVRTLHATLSHSFRQDLHACRTILNACYRRARMERARARRPSCKLLHAKARRSTNTRGGTRAYNSDDSGKKRGRAFWFTSAIWPRFSSDFILLCEPRHTVHPLFLPVRSMRRSSETVSTKGTAILPYRARPDNDLLPRRVKSKGGKMDFPCKFPETIYSRASRVPSHNL